MCNNETNDIIPEKKILNRYDVINSLKYYDDSNFVFEAEQHVYTYNEDVYISVTQFIAQFHNKFDSDGKSKSKAKQLGVSQEYVLEYWKEINTRANFIGTAVHKWIENYYNGEYQELPVDMDIIDRINKFNIIYATDLYKLTPVKFEQKMFSKKWKIAGTIDALFLYNGNLIILDFKTNKEFNFVNKYGDKLIGPFEGLENSHINMYSIQISLYVLLLREIGLYVKVGYLLYIGPNEPAKIHRCIDYTEKLEIFLKKYGEDAIIY